MEFTTITKDILAPVISGMLLAVILGAGSVAWWGIQRMVKGQDKIHDVLKEISSQISSVRERTVQLETRETLRDQMANRQHAENQHSIELLWREMGKLKENKKGRA